MIGFIFPAFAHDYKNHPGSSLPGFLDTFNDLVNQIAAGSEPRLVNFDFKCNNFLDDELLTQYITYIYSCASAETLRKSGLIPDVSAGYSMGIYAALTDAGSISFPDGLQLIKNAYQSIEAKTRGLFFAMGTVIGLNCHDLQNIMKSAGNSLEITNRNSTHSFVISGIFEEIEKALELSLEEGALHTKLLRVTVPYHSRFLEEAAHAFRDSIHKIQIRPASNRLISLIDQKWFSTPEEIKTELTRNLYFHLDWFETHRHLLNCGIDTFIECGPSRGLVKNSKFTEGHFKFYALDSPMD